MRIVFIGPPGCGKGTQSVRVAERTGSVHLSTGEVLRAARAAGDPVGVAASEYLDDGRLVPDELVLRLVSERLGERDCSHGYVFDGFPRTRAQAVALDELLARYDASLELAVRFAIADDELFRRLAKRGRADDQNATIRRRLEQYAQMTEPLLDYYRERGVLQEIDAVGTEDEVFGRIERALAAAGDLDAAGDPTQAG